MFLFVDRGVPKIIPIVYLFWIGQWGYMPRMLYFSMDSLPFTCKHPSHQLFGCAQYSLSHLQPIKYERMYYLFIWSQFRALFTQKFEGHIIRCRIFSSWHKWYWWHIWHFQFAPAFVGTHNYSESKV